MTREVIVSLLIPYANYDVKYNVTDLEELDETKALIILAIASNKEQYPTNTLKDILHDFYHLNSNYDDLFTDELRILIENRTIVNDNNNLPSLDSYIGNFNIDLKIQNFLDNNSGFFGNSENKKSYSLFLRIGLFNNMNYQEYKITDNNLVVYNDENACIEFVNLNSKNNNKYNNSITEYINNKLSDNQNLLTINYSNLEKIKKAENLIYLKTDCKFKLNIDENNHANIFCTSSLEQKIYDDYYLTKIYYLDLLQLLCEQISFNLSNLNIKITEINDLKDSLEFWEINDINDFKEVFSLDNEAYIIIDNKLRKLFIYKQEVTDEINNKATWTKLYFHILSDNELKELINKNLFDNPDFINKIYSEIKNSVINDFILETICKDDNTIRIYKELINNNFDNCLSFIIKNKIDIELINELFPKKINDYLNKQISSNNDEFLKLLKLKRIIDPNLQKIIIRKCNFNYSNKEHYLLDCKLEDEIINEIRDSKKQINNANTYIKDKKELENLYSALNNKIDAIDKLNKDINLICLKELLEDLKKKKSNIKN